MKKLVGCKTSLILACIWLLFFSSVISAQVITGKVVDEANNPLPGVNVFIKGTTSGTVTDIDGMYRITVNDPVNDILVFSFIGYFAEEMQVSNRQVLDVQLIPSLETLEEVVVIGYGTMRKRDLSGAVASVNADQLKDIPVASVAQALTGRLAGVEITTSEGSPDAEVRIRVRGGGSITQDNTPLIIIDGFPADRISDIPPSDIESIDVLKDAASSSIYGARGANGVVIITTKRGVKDKVSVKYNAYVGYKKLANKLDVLSPSEFILYQYERALPSFLDRRDFENRYGTLEHFDSLYGNAPATDWQEEVFGRQALTTYHNLNISGGSKNSNFSLSLTRNDDEGIMLGSGYIRNSANLRIESKPVDRLKLNFDAKYNDLDVLGAGTSDPGTSTINKLKHSVVYAPIDPPEELEQFTEDDYYETSELVDPVTLTEDDYKQAHEVIATLNAGLTLTIFEGLDVKTSFGINKKDRINDRFYGLSTSTARRYGDKPVVVKESKNTEKVLWFNTVNYKKTFNTHNINLLVGQELITTKENGLTTESRSFPENIGPDIAIGSMALGEDWQKPETDLSEDRLMSFFGRAHYILRDKYIASFSLRADGSSKFAPGYQWGYFPSGSAAWRISDESFFDNVPIISNMKIRASYGQSGNNRIKDVLWTTSYVVGTSKQYYLLETPYTYYYPSALANPALKWETTVSRNVGLDMGLFNNRLNATVDLYKNTGKDLLIPMDIPPLTGYTEQMQNIGQTTNRGVEITADAYIIDRGDFKLSMNFNISFNKSRVDNLGGGDYMTASSGWNNDIGDDYLVRVGDPVGLMYGFETDGYYTPDDFVQDPETGEFVLGGTGQYVTNDGVANNYNIMFSGFGPGAYKFKDIGQPVDSLGNPVDDGNLVTFDDDRTVIGNANPKHFGGINIMMAYKGFDLSVFLNWVYGQDIYNANKIEFTSGYRKYRNLLTDMGSDQRWTTINEDGDLLTTPEEMAEYNADAKIWKPTTGRYLFHSWAVEDGSFLRVNNITLGYTLPNQLTKKVFINEFRVYVTANNLHTFTRYSGYDPEVNARYDPDDTGDRDRYLTPGVDYSAYPRSRSILAGINLTF